MLVTFRPICSFLSPLRRSMIHAFQGDNHKFEATVSICLGVSSSTDSFKSSGDETQRQAYLCREINTTPAIIELSAISVSITNISFVFNLEHVAFVMPDLKPFIKFLNSINISKVTP